MVQVPPWWAGRCSPFPPTANAASPWPSCVLHRKESAHNFGLKLKKDPPKCYHLVIVIGAVLLHCGVWGLFGLGYILRYLLLYLRQPPCSCSKEPIQKGEETSQVSHTFMCVELTLCLYRTGPPKCPPGI